jgi:hypothetical protein
MKPSGNPPILRESVTQIARPLTNIMVVRVAMNAGIRQTVTVTPLTAPSPAPVPSMASTAMGTARGCPASQPSSAAHDLAPDHTGQRDHRRHRKIDPADDQHQGQPR